MAEADEVKWHTLRIQMHLFMDRSGDYIKKVILCIHKKEDNLITGASTQLNSGPNNMPFLTVEPEKLTKKFYKNVFCALLGDGACI